MLSIREIEFKRGFRGAEKQRLGRMKNCQVEGCDGKTLLVQKKIERIVKVSVEVSTLIW
jgi:hypothetical protein